MARAQNFTTHFHNLKKAQPVCIIFHSKLRFCRSRGCLIKQGALLTMSEQNTKKKKKRWFFKGSLVKKMVLYRTINTQRIICMLKKFFAWWTGSFDLWKMCCIWFYVARFWKGFYIAPVCSFIVTSFTSQQQQNPFWCCI